MKKFLKKSVLFVLLIVVFVESISSILLYTDLYLKLNYPGYNIYNAIDKSKKKDKAKILLLGDSVGAQLFPNDNTYDGINSLACNQAIGVIGQFFLLKNYLEQGNDLDKVVVLFNPLSFLNNLDQIYTYHYFLKPFYQAEYTPLFTQTATKQVNKIPFNRLSQIPHVKITGWAPEIELEKKNYTFLSPISVEYLAKIKALSKKYSFDIEIMSTPTSTELKTQIDQMDLTEIRENNLQDEFNNYFKNMVYVDSREFVDGIHFYKPSKYVDSVKRDILSL